MQWNFRLYGQLHISLDLHTQTAYCKEVCKSHITTSIMNPFQAESEFKIGSRKPSIAAEMRAPALNEQVAFFVITCT
jgi:hypothetical protein